ncbi:hypothetical protein Back2_20510 [Nocardioides baekrokdamisoli]|uniref:Uncharacterized protein n=1 Tax=Nocardioides baekrokdamisoli TaxID=1804624 RepID=A0A3G9J2T7_9ACTN|nr:hypothetical protein [Nocardioides baekrokdamisoli]BBH17764.1 hypothetical protein Back2_20510 [Nocardioides baekrokdamisoli]
MSTADFVTIDAFDKPPSGRLRWRKSLRTVVESGIPGLRGASVNYTNNATHSLVPALVPGGSALVAAWNSPEAAEAAFRGPLRSAIDGERRFSLDGEVVRVRIDSESERDHWHGWTPRSEGAEPLAKDEPMVAIVHGILRRGELFTFVRNNLHAASRAAHHPGHRGSIDISSDLPFEHTSISLWKTYALAQDFAYKPGGHASGMKHALTAKTHRVGVFIQVRPLAASGTLGIESSPFPGLPAANRGGI